MTILQCPQCFSHRASIVNTKPLSARCADCGTPYPIATESPAAAVLAPDPYRPGFGQDPPPDADELSPDEQPRYRRKTRKASNNAKRSKYDDLPPVIPVPPAADPAALGLTSVMLQQTLAGGATSLRRYHRQALLDQRRLGPEFAELEAKWRLETPWLASMDAIHRTCAVRAMAWRPTFLAALALTHSPVMACRAAKIVIGTYSKHKRDDLVFAEQCEEAEAQAVQLLQDACWKSAVEGDAETQYYMGIPIGYVRKHDSRLRIEMLRAHVPGKFKTPGNVVNVNQDNRAAFIVDPATQDALIAKRLDALKRIKEAEGRTAEGVKQTPWRGS